MSTTRNRFDELSAAWALGAASAGETQELLALAGEDPRLLEKLRALEEAALHLPLAFEPLDPPENALAALLERIEGVGGSEADAGSVGTDALSRAARTLRLDRARWALATAAGLMILGLSLVFQVARLDRAVEEKRREVAALEASVADRERLLDVLDSPRLEVARLAGLNRAEQAAGTVIWDTERNVALLRINDLPPLTENESYQFWVFPEEGEPASAAVFSVRGPGEEILLRLDRFPAGDRRLLTGFLITRERQGGAEEPSGERYMGVRLP